MSDKETRKRLVILLISLFGIAVIIGLYAWVWFDFYHPFFLRWEDIKLYRRGHILILGIYTVIFLLFSNLYGGQWQIFIFFFRKRKQRVY